MNHDKWCECPNCHQPTAWDAPSGKRCIPCGFGLVPKEQQAGPEESARRAKLLSGGKK